MNQVTLPKIPWLNRQHQRKSGDHSKTHPVRDPNGIIETALFSEQIPLPHPLVQIDKHLRKCWGLIHRLLSHVSSQYHVASPAYLGNARQGRAEFGQDGFPGRSNIGMKRIELLQSTPLGRV